MGVAGQNEVRVGWAQNELVGLAILTLDTQAAAVIVDSNDRAPLEAATEVLDARGRTNAW
jgi:hypothetical protein